MGVTVPERVQVGVTVSSAVRVAEDEEEGVGVKEEVTDDVAVEDGVTVGEMVWDGVMLGVGEVVGARVSVEIKDAVGMLLISAYHTSPLSLWCFGRAEPPMMSAPFVLKS